MKKAILGAVIAVLSVTVLTACDRAASVASANVSKAADNFEIMRKIVFYNAIHDVYMYEVDGRCSVGVDTTEDQLYVTCLVAPETVVKHYLGQSDNVSYFVIQTEAAKASTYNHRIIFRPQTLLRSFEMDLENGKEYAQPTSPFDTSNVPLIETEEELEAALAEIRSRNPSDAQLDKQWRGYPAQQ